VKVVKDKNPFSEKEAWPGFESLRKKEVRLFQEKEMDRRSWRRDRRFSILFQGKILVVHDL
jgi:hypothetical protein